MQSLVLATSLHLAAKTSLNQDHLPITLSIVVFDLCHIKAEDIENYSNFRFVVVCSWCGGPKQPFIICFLLLVVEFTKQTNLDLA